MRYRHFLPQAAHLPHIQLIRHRMHHTARSEEHEPFEEGMRHQMENAGSIRAHTDTDEHITELAHSGIGENPLDVVLCYRNRCGKKRR